MSTTLAFDLIARDRASRTFDHVGDSAGRSSGKLKAWAKVGALAVAGGAVLAGKALIDMTKGAIEDEAAQAKLAKQMQNSAGATKKQVAGVEDWISAQGKATGVADDDLRPALSRLVTATKDVGDAQKLTRLAMDVSAGSGKSLESVSTALMKAQNGQVSSLSRLGINTKDAKGETVSMEEAVKRMSDTFGGSAAKAADTNAGKMQRLKLMYDETKESIGAKLLPIVGQLADWMLNKGVPAAQKFGDWFKEKILPPLKQFAEDMAPKAKTVIDNLKQGFQDAKPFLELAGKALTNVVIPALAWMAGKQVEKIAAEVKLIGKALGAVGDIGIWLWNKALQPTFRFIVNGVGDILSMFGDLLSTMSNVPGFGWAEKAADKMFKAATQAHNMAENIKKIPPRKDVAVVVTYTYQGKRNPGKEDQMDFAPRQSATKTAGQRYMELIADGIEAGGKKLDKILKSSRDRLKDKLGQIRDDMKSMSESIASALNQTDFSGSLEEHLASLTGTNGGLTNLVAVFEKLKNSVSKEYLAALMGSGNIGLATALANDPNAAAQASALYGQNSAMANSLGDQTAQAALGDKIDKAIREEIGKLRDDLREQPGKQAKEIRKELSGLDVNARVTNPSNAGGGAHVRGAW